MAIEKNQIFLTPSGKLLKVVAVFKSGFHHLKEINSNGKFISELINNSGVVVHRVYFVYSEETIGTFKKQNL